MKKLLIINILCILLGTSLFAANTEVLTKAMVKLITKQKTLENAIIVLKKNQNKIKHTNNYQGSSSREIDSLNEQIREIKKELYFAKKINTVTTKYTRNNKQISAIDSFISKNR